MHVWLHPSSLGVDRIRLRSHDVERCVGNDCCPLASIPVLDYPFPGHIGDAKIPRQLLRALVGGKAEESLQHNNALLRALTFAPRELLDVVARAAVLSQLERIGRCIG